MSKSDNCPLKKINFIFTYFFNSIKSGNIYMFKLIVKLKK